MSYTKQTWVTGETITAQKLNHMEDGINGAIPFAPDTFVVTFTFDDENAAYVSDVPFSDIVAAAGQYKPILAVVESFGTIPLVTKYDNQSNIVNFHYSDWYTNGEEEQAGSLPVAVMIFRVTYDSELSLTIGEFAELAFNFQAST